jgi:hypothetical protein
MFNLAIMLPRYELDYVGLRIYTFLFQNFRYSVLARNRGLK